MLPTVCIIIPAGCAPIMGTLYYAQHKAKKLGVVATNYSDEDDAKVAEKANTPLLQRIIGHLVDIDVFGEPLYRVQGRAQCRLQDLLPKGLLLFAAGWACVLLPLTLVNKAATKWSSPSVIAMLTCGGIILIAFGYYEARWSPKPLFPLRFFKNKTILACGFIGELVW
jgi:hypothetical protein